MPGYVEHGAKMTEEGGGGVGGGEPPQEMTRLSMTQCALFGENDTLSTRENSSGNVTKVGRSVLTETVKLATCCPPRYPIQVTALSLFQAEVRYTDKREKYSPLPDEKEAV
jgi:hypothetical protein